MLKEKNNGEIEKIFADEWGFEQIIADSFNGLKARLFNLIEGQGAFDKETKEAQKGLIKGFCNDKYKDTIEEMRWFMRRLGHLADADSAIPPMTAEPLEHR